MQVQHDARAGLPRRGEGAPAERRVDVVGVHDPGPGAADGVRHVLGGEPALQQPGRRAPVAERRGVAREHLRLLAQVLADQPREILDRALLAAREAVAVVQEEDHGSTAA